MNATQWAAWVGTCTTIVAGLGWNIYTRLTSGPKLRVTVFAGLDMPGAPKLLKITVHNTGTGPTTITNIAFETYLSRWVRFRRKPSDPRVSLDKYQGPPMPYKLDVGDQFMVVMQQNQTFNEWLSSGNLWCVVHSVSTKPALGEKWVSGKGRPGERLPRKLRNALRREGQ
jgi:hypothetical protein